MIMRMCVLCVCLEFVAKPFVIQESRDERVDVESFDAWLNGTTVKDIHERTYI